MIPMRHSPDISPKYDTPIFEAVALQMFLGLVGFLILDGGATARIYGIGEAAFWGGVFVLVSRNPQSPTKIDLELIRFGSLPVTVAAFFLVQFIWHLGGLQ